MIYLKILILFPIFIFAVEANHLLLSKIVIAPDIAESISITNPTDESINLSDYYICDDNEYYKMQTESDLSPSHLISGFTAQFPNIDIEPDDTLLLVLNEGYSSFYTDITPDLFLFGEESESMIETDDSSFGLSSDDKLDDATESIILFKWDGNTENNIEDVDYFIWGGIQGAVNKTGEGNYVEDTQADEQFYFEQVPEDYYAFSRVAGLEETNENSSGGNGIIGEDGTRDDETSEDFRQSWEIVSIVEIGCTDSTAENYNPDAIIDDGSCEYSSSGTEFSIDDIVHNCGDEMGESIECDGEYDLSSQSASQCPLYEQEITTTGIVMDYFDITPWNGPHSFTIQDADGNQIDFVVWPDDFDITLTDLNVLTQTPFGRYEVQITGELGAFCDDNELLDINSEWQATVEYESNITIIQEFDPDDFGCTDPEAHNYDPSAEEDDGSCSYPIETTIIEVIQNCGDEMGSLIECEGEYDLSLDTAASCVYYDSLVTVSGLLVDYFDVTAFGGPHSFTLSDEDGYRIAFSIWPSSNEYQDGFDITLTDLNKLRFSPFGNYFLEITGTVGAYCDDDMILDIYNEWQLTVEHIEDLVIIEEIGGYFVEDPLINKVQINPEPFVLIPSLGETLDFTYSNPENSRVTIRVFDLSGRLITTLIDNYVEQSGIWYNGVNPVDPEDSDTWINSNQSAWDGRDHIGQIVAPGTYIIHIESYNFSTGESGSDMAPIVIGVVK